MYFGLERKTGILCRKSYYRRFTSYSPVGLSQSFDNFQGVQKFMGTFYSQKILPAKAIITLRRQKRQKTINAIICNADLSKRRKERIFKVTQTNYLALI